MMTCAYADPSESDKDTMIILGSFLTTMLLETSKSQTEFRDGVDE